MTKIEWTEKTWNPIVGCSIVSSGCTNCYAMRQANRLLDKPGSHYEGTTEKINGNAVWTGKVAMAPSSILYKPLSVKRPTMWFVNSMGDLFHEDVPDEWILDVFTIMAICHQHTFQVLTKRPDRMAQFLAKDDLLEDIYTNWYTFDGGAREVYNWPLHNVWLGTSVEDQKTANERVPDLLRTPASVRFLSAEPLLGPIDLRNLGGEGSANSYGHNGFSAIWKGNQIRPCLDWVIVGGESGKGARPMHPDWARSLRDQCVAEDVAFHFKQWGEWLEVDGPRCQRVSQKRHRSDSWMKPDGEIIGRSPKIDFLMSPYGTSIVRNVGKKAAGRMLDDRTWDEFPAMANGS